MKLRLKEIRQVSEQVYTYVFGASRRFAFLPGQYMEWTLAGVPFDSRGNRRTFTIASSPTEDEILVGVKFYEPSSTYKKTMRAMKPGDDVYVSQLAGNFTLPHDPGQKLAFIAGGIGITPFRSMAKYLIDKSEQRDIVLLYVVGKPEEAAYKDVFSAAAQYGLRTVILTGSGKAFDAATIQRHIPDSEDRTFMLSGPQGMVEDAKSHLKELGVGATNIKTDYFSGY
jgi:ferredoxin-NADP reductase